MYLILANSQFGLGSVKQYLKTKNIEEPVMCMDSQTFSDELMLAEYDVLVFDFYGDLAVVSALRVFEPSVKSLKVFAKSLDIGQIYECVCDDVHIMPDSRDIMALLWDCEVFSMENCISASEQNSELCSVDLKSISENSTINIRVNSDAESSALSLSITNDSPAVAVGNNDNSQDLAPIEEALESVEVIPVKSAEVISSPEEVESISNEFSEPENESVYTGPKFEAIHAEVTQRLEEIPVQSEETAPVKKFKLADLFARTKAGSNTSEVINVVSKDTDSEIPDASEKLTAELQEIKDSEPCNEPVALLEPVETKHPKVEVVSKPAEIASVDITEEPLEQSIVISAKPQPSRKLRHRNLQISRTPREFLLTNGYITEERAAMLDEVYNNAKLQGSVLTYEDTAHATGYINDEQYLMVLRDYLHVHVKLWDELCKSDVVFTNYSKELSLSIGLIELESDSVKTFVLELNKPNPVQELQKRYESYFVYYTLGDYIKRRLQQ